MTFSVRKPGASEVAMGSAICLCYPGSVLCKHPPTAPSSVDRGSSLQSLPQDTQQDSNNYSRKLPRYNDDTGMHRRGSFLAVQHEYYWLGSPQSISHWEFLQDMQMQLIRLQMKIRLA